jgi:hypothetical protein
MCNIIIAYFDQHKAIVLSLSLFSIRVFMLRDMQRLYYLSVYFRPVDV